MMKDLPDSRGRYGSSRSESRQLMWNAAASCVSGAIAAAIVGSQARWMIGGNAVHLIPSGYLIVAFIGAVVSYPAALLSLTLLRYGMQFKVGAAHQLLIAALVGAIAGMVFLPVTLPMDVAQWMTR
jgi:hypothetical protein